MSESPATEALSAEKRALLALRRMRARLDEVERSRHEPIAVVGMACRFPGGALSPEAFWGLLRAGVDAITEVPRERWDLEAWYDPDPEAPGKTYARHGGFLAGVDQFDAAFFGLAPREAAAMDPQQRLLLEVAWEALEDAGQPADRLARSASGVFVGMTAGDYAQVLDRAGREAIEAYWITGNSPNFAAGRLSYLLGLQGPSLVVDTACSSSLVAVHLACQSLRTAESRLALAAGVNLTLVPDGTVALSKARMLAPGGRCRTFDAAADGYVRGEGCGVVVLKRLSDALADGDRIHALIRATAVNQDGRSSGLTVPNGLAQEAVLRQALAAAGVEPAEVGYVEAHGSGTALGDPIELRALGAVLGPGRAQGHPLLVGSVKTNIGHLEAAAGIAGLIKTVLAVRHGEVPPHLHFTTANPHVPWAELPIAVPTAVRAWTGRRVAGVSSFGASGTNAHVIVEAPPAPAAAPPGAFPPERPLHLLTVSARTETALAALAGRYAERLAAADAPALADAAFTANAGRSHLAHRAAVVAATPDDARAQLRALSAGESGPAVLRGRAGAERPRVAFLFTGQGSQYTGMGQELYASEPAFRKALDECDERLRPHLDRPLLSVLYPPPGERSPLDDTTYTQPALFAVEWSLCQMWRSWGVEPAAVMGHSVGEYAAACVAGVLSVEDALKLLAARARLMGALPPGGAMWAVAASEAAVADALAVTGVPDVSVAAVNADDEVVLSGPDAALVAVAAAFQARGARARRLAVSHAFHSALMDPAREAFARVAADVRYAPPRLALVSNLSGDVAREEVADAAYWVRQLREPVRFAQGLKALRARGHAVFLEVGPHPTLCALGQKAEPDGPAAWLPTLRRGRGDWTQVLETLGRLYVEGADVDWAAFDGGRPRSRVTLPSYPFERQRHWVDGGSSARPRAAGGPVLHALLGSRVASPVEDALFAAEIGPRSWPALADHRIHDTVVMPATAFVEMAWAAAREVTGGDACALEDVVIAAPLAFADATERALQTVVSAEDEGGWSVRIFSRAPGEAGGPAAWRRHASARVRAGGDGEEAAGDALDAVRARCAREVAVGGYYDSLRAAGVAFGPAFRGLTALWQGDGEALGRVAVPVAAGDADGYAIHPALLDASWQAVGALVAGTTAEPCLPVGVDRVRVHVPGAREAWSHVQLRSGGEGAATIVADVRLLDGAGRPVASVEGLRLRPATADALRRDSAASVDGWLFELAWRETPALVASESVAPGTWLVLSDRLGFGRALAERGRQIGATVVEAERGGDAATTEAARWVEPTREALAALWRRAAAHGPITGVAYLWSVEGGAPETFDDLRRQTEAAVAPLVHLVQALSERRDAPAPRLLVVTRGAQAVGDEAPAALASSALAGLVRTIALEHPELRCASVDLDPAEAPAATAAPLAAELQVAPASEESAYRRGRRYVSRLARFAAPRDGEDRPVELHLADRGVLDSLRVRDAARRAPGAGEVEIRVRAAGVNFRDVLSALGAYQGPAGPLGSECAGEVLAVGDGVTGLRPGQAVVAIAADSFRTHVTAPAALVVPKPEALAFDTAAAAPIAFLTAVHALEHLARLAPGERVLVHAAAGGVGLAAVQVARRAGAEVFATAGSDAKRAYLRSLGVAHVMDSRSVSFADEVRVRTGGEGVDVVLNSLNGELIPASLAALRPGGRFLEIGSAGVWTPEQVAAARADVAYHRIYLGHEDPAHLRAMLARVLEDLAAGGLQPLPLRTFALRDAAEAFRFMAQARHIGKLALALPAPAALRVGAEATYLVTGGLGSLGLIVARWLVGHGARHLALVGRSEPGEHARAAIAALERDGARVVTVAADVAREDDVRGLFDRLRALPPLRGVVHAAGVLDDGVLAQQGWDRFERVFAPKAWGAWHLDRATRELPLDFFVLFSSASALFGSAGQGNYAAANAFLDALAHRRRAEGRPALSLDWGPWAGGGMAASVDAKDRARWDRQGLRPIEPERGLAALDRVLSTGAAQLGVLPLDVRALSAALGSAPPRLSELLGAPGGVETRRARSGAAFSAQLAEAAPAKRPALVLAHVGREVRGVLGLPASARLDPQQGLRDLGLDSLMALELRNRLQRSTGQALPATVAFDHPTLQALAAHLAAALGVEKELPVAAAAPAARAADEPIAVIGLACRFPGGATTPEAYWALLRDGVDAVREVPRDRWDLDAYYDPDPDAPGKMYTRHGAFLEGIDRFDAAFFGISPREAARMDPQQRLLLEVTWEALERAGQSPDRLLGSRTGVFIGLSTGDYAQLQARALAPERIDAYFGTGSAASVAAGRVSYLLGLQGPSLSVDTACSSSLVTVHLACQSLRSGESRLALAGGVNVILSPQITINFCRARMLAADGRCKTFDAAADGYVRGEGAGMVVLKRLSDALADGDEVLAVIRGTAVNQDGRSGGLTVPNGPAQEALLREALAAAGLAPADVSYVEAHGTGTALGDPIEMKALGAVLGAGRAPERPLVVGSVKTNLGHLEAAAGVAGLIKVVLALRHRQIPPHLHFERPNPHLALAAIPAVIPTSLMPWPADRPRVAGVSSFGFSGTNAHVVVEEAPASERPLPERERPLHLLALSARSEEALAALAGRFADHFGERPSAALADAAHAASAGRAHFAHRLAVRAAGVEDARRLLGAAARGEAPVGATSGHFEGEAPEIAFLFTGQGAQYAGMGRDLYETQPAFRAALDRCAGALRGRMDAPLLSVLFEGGGALDQTAFTQPALFALEWALYEMWRGWGVEPSAVIGHSLGEYVAACAAGVLSLEDGLALVARRGQLMQALRAPGAMCAVAAAEDVVAPLVARHGAVLSLAAVNGPEDVVVSGAEEAVGEVERALQARGARTRRLNVSHAFHSPLIEPMLDELERTAAAVAYAPPRRTLVSNLTGEPVARVDAAYWRAHTRGVVRFAAGVSRLWNDGHRVFVEVGPSPVLLGMAERCVGAPDGAAAWLPTLRRGRADWEQALESLAELYVRGVKVDWDGFDRGYARRKVALPTYPFERERHWIEGLGAMATAAPAAPSSPAATYEVAWRSAPLPPPRPAGERTGPWLVLCDRAGVGADLARGLEARGERCRRIEAADADEVGRRLREVLAEEGGACRGVVHLWSLDAGSETTARTLDARLRRTCGSVLDLVHALGAAGTAAPLWLVTRGAQAVDGGAGAPAQAALWGLGRTLALEHPELRPVRVDLDPAGEDAAPLLGELDAADGEDQVAYRGGRRLVARLVRAVAEDAPAGVRPDATYLVTGGLGALGLRVAARLARSGARHLVLVGRRAPGASAEGALAALRAQGVDVRVVSADVAKADDVGRALAEAAAGGPPLRGLVHAAGTLDDGVLLEQSWPRFAAVLAPKAAGALALHEATRGLDLDFFVLFSSAAALLGSAGQGGYAAANAFLDGLAHWRRAQGLPATSIAWGPWAETGMAAAGADGQQQRRAARGVSALAPDSALAAFDRLLAGERAHVGVLDVDWARLAHALAGAAPPLLRELTGAPSAVEDDRPELPRRLAQTPSAARAEVVARYVGEEAARVLGHDGSRGVAPRQGFASLGLDSLMAVELRNRLQRGTGRTLPATLAFDYPTVESLAAHLCDALGVGPAAAPEEAAAPRTSDEPIAIVGLGCRFPGADGPEAFWRMLREGVDAVREVPSDRWDVDALYDPDPDAVGRMSTRWGGFLEDVDRFDAPFFGISPREAMSLDPQQRLLLEVSWEALERAGIAADRLAGSRTGVFVGIGGSDYAHLLAAADPALLDGYAGTGTSSSAAAGRLSYVLGLQGPSLSVDTACSSSLVAVHLACQSLRQGECSLALAGGVNLMLSPQVSVVLSKARMLSPDGRCKTFDAAADGYVRGEGCGVVALKRLSDARADGDRVFAVILGSALNQDGRSSGLTVPNGPAQQSVLRDAIAQAGVRAADVAYVEAHGTGTPLGDPIELRALGAVYGESRPADTPLLVGSVKTNVGHLEAAAGIAGLIKVVLSLQEAEIPPHLHFREGNPHAPWAELPLVIPTEPRPWPASGGRRLAGLSSFSFTGTNAHMVLAEAPAEAREGLATTPERPVHLLPLSAPSETSLRALAGLYAERLGAPDVPLPDACFTAATGRAPQPERLALRASSREEACAALRAFASGGEPPDLWRGRGERAPGVVFLFTGQGSQYAGMGRQLYETEPAFRAALERCDALLRGHLDRPLLSLLYPADGTTPLDETACAQPALFALEYALAELWRSWGIEPAALLGHSLGEYVAACVAGVFPLEEGLALVAARGKLLQALPAGGGMVAVLAEEAAVAALLASHGGALAIAAVNGPTSVVVSGPGGELERFEAALAASGVQSRRLAVSHAFHSPLMDPALDELERIASRLTYAAPRLPVGSNLTGRRAEGDDLRTAAYWRRHTRQTVRFADGVRALHADGHRVFLEIGPHPTLAALGRQCVPGEDGLWLGSLRRQGGDWAQMAESLGRLYVAGAPVDWAGFDRAFPRRKVVLPTTRFERRRHWIGDGAPSARAAARPVPEGAAEPWLGRRLRSPSLRDVVFETELGLDSLPYLGDHRVSGVAVAPAAAYVAMALGAAEAAWAGGGPWAIEQLAIAEPLVFPEEGRRLVQVIVSGEDAESPGFRIVSAAAEASPDGGWTEHAQGRLRSVDASEARPEDVAASEVIARCTEELPAGECYRGLRERGFELGPAFQAVRHVWRRDGEALGEVRLPAVLPPNGHHLLHPVLFDASCHVAGAALPGAGEHAYMLVGVDRLAVHAPPGDHVWSHARLAPGVTGGEETVTGDLRLLDDAGRVVASAEGLRFKRARREALAALASGSTADWLYEVAWRPRPLRAEAAEAAGAAAAQVAEAIGPEARRLLGDDGVAAAAAALPELEAVATGFVHRALAALGCDLRPGRRFGAGEAAAWGVLDRHQRLFGRLLDMLVEDGVLRPVDGGWEVLVEPPAADPEAGARALASRTRVGAAELELVRRCGERLADVLRGRADALALLFPGGSTDALERVYRDSPLAVASNAIVQRAVSATLAARPADRPFRLLEVGAGTGATTASVLPSLPASRAEYWFTDVSAAFTERAAARFAGHGFLRTALLDLDRDPHAQGFERHAFDCVVAVNVLHATRDLGETLARLRSLLAPDGLLVVSEATRRLRWLDVTFGLTEGWWSFTDRTRRPAHALLDRPAWLDTLAAAGFEPAVVPGDGAPDTPQAVFLARAPLLAADRPPESWLVLADRGGLGGALARRLRERGDRCVLVASGPADAERPDGPWQVDPSSPADFRRLIAGARAAGGAPPTRVVNLWPLDATAAEGAAAEDVHAAARLACAGLLHLAQAAAQEGAGPIWVVTRGAHAVDAGDPAPAVAQAPVWGLGRTVAVERPEIWGGLLDLAPRAAADDVDRVIAEVTRPDGEDQVAWRGGVRHAARIAPRGAAGSRAVRPRPDGAYLVTGGLGRLGLKVGAWLAENGAGRIVLTGRRGLPDRAEWPALPPGSDAARQAAAVQAIEARGATVEVAAVDVADAEAMTRLLDRCAAALPLRGIVHAAADLRTDALDEMTESALDAALRPKVAGAWVLHRWSAAREIDFLVFFSSTTALFGSRYLAHYAAANAFLDALAHHRRARGLPALSVNWGVWEDMREGGAEHRREFAGGGLRPMPSARALRALGQVAGGESAQVTVADVDWPALKAVYETKRRRPFLAEVGGAPAVRRAAPAGAPRADLAARLLAARADDRWDVLAEHVRGEVARVLRWPDARTIELQRGLFDLGLDSLMSVELKTRLEASLDRALPSTLTFNYPSVAALTDYLAREVLALAVEAPAPAGAAVAARDEDDLSEDELASRLAETLGELR